MDKKRKSKKQAVLSPWFWGAETPPVNPGIYKLRLCHGWRVVRARWFAGNWYTPGPITPGRRIDVKFYPFRVWQGVLRGCE